jgi:hypothetical protein
MSKNITLDSIKRELSYDPHTGFFTWKKQGNGVTIGMRAGSLISNGYRRIGVNWAYHLEHRLAWFYMTGEWPESEIDHIDNNPSNNAFSNLRLSTRAQNQHNQKMHRTNKSGVKGVSFNKFSRKWIAEIRDKRKRVYFGMFADLSSAESAIKEAREKLHGEFANHG